MTTTALPPQTDAARPSTTGPSTRPTSSGRRRRRVVAALTAGTAVLVLAGGAVALTATRSEPATPATSVPGVAGHTHEARAGALVGHGTTVLPDSPPVADDAHAGAIVGRTADLAGR